MTLDQWYNGMVDAFSVIGLIVTVGIVLWALREVNRQVK